MTDTRAAGAVASNAATAWATSEDGYWMPLSAREGVSAAVAAAVEPLIRTDEARRFWDVARDFPEPFRSLIAEVAGRHSLPQPASQEGARP